MRTACHAVARALYLTTCFALGLLVLGPLAAWSSPAPVAVATTKVLDGTQREAVWQCLLAAGYHGDPTDGDEAIYAPESAIDACITQTVYPPREDVWQCVRDAGYPGDPLDESFYAPDSVINACIAQSTRHS